VLQRKLLGKNRLQGRVLGTTPQCAAAKTLGINRLQGRVLGAIPQCAAAKTMGKNRLQGRADRVRASVTQSCQQLRQRTAACGDEQDAGEGKQGWALAMQSCQQVFTFHSSM